MADRKISDLTALTTPASGDYLPIVDISEAAAASKNKRITIEELMRGVPDGTAAAPGIAFETDPNTGIYSPGADQLAVATNGTGRLFVDASGNVGIGATPNSYAGYSTLTINNTSGSELDFEVNGTLTSDIYTDSTGTYWTTRTAVPIALRTNSVERLRVTSAGLVGIGASAPDSLLQLNGPAARFRIYDSNGTNQFVSLQQIGAVSYLTGRNNTGFGPISIGQNNGTTSQTAIYIDSTSRVGIGTTSPSSALHVSGSGTVIQQVQSTGGAAELRLIANTQTNASYNNIYSGDGTNWNWRIGGGDGTTNTLTFATGGSEKARIDSSGRLLVGTSSAPTGALSQYSKFSIYLNNQTTSAGGQLNLVGGARGLLSTGNKLGQLIFTDSTDGEYGKITCELDATPGASDYPGRLVFSTTSDSASSPTERMRITSGGLVDIGGYGNSNLSVTTPVGTPLQLNRTGSDGELVRFKQDGTTEGNITVSGTTVSYNGAHLARWSQLASGAERTEILRGSVLSNLDEMCEWSEEDNEQLNRMKVSDVEGDPNVSGVFQAWDDDDDTYTNDFYCAMTGDFIIRIAEGVTVERGDLLMSAGDGTAKPQDDDIIRSKTIAKVTSTNVSCTYADGSYCVPCVLMAC